MSLNYIGSDTVTNYKSVTANDVTKIDDNTFTVGLFTVNNFLSHFDNITVVDDNNETVNNCILKSHIIGKVNEAANRTYFSETCEEIIDYDVYMHSLSTTMSGSF